MHATPRQPVVIVEPQQLSALDKLEALVPGFDEFLGGGALNLHVLGSIKPMACPKCHKSFVRGPDWACCPYCGAKLPPAPTKEKAKEK